MVNNDQKCNDRITYNNISPISTSLNLYHQNICGLRRKVNELICFLNHDLPHFICIYEHHLNKKLLQSTL
jgi:hypothetical protein